MADNQITPFQLTDQFTMDNFNQRINETNIALQKKATVELDEVYTLPLSDSAVVMPSLSSTFSKSKFGKVSVHIACVPTKSLSAYESITVATLPEGYRPAVITELYPGLSILYHSYNLGVWQVEVDGRILFTPTVAVSTSTSIHGTLEFDAATL